MEGAIHCAVIDCQQGGFSDMVQDSRGLERTREIDGENFVGGCTGAGGDAFGRERFAGAGIAGEFKPGVADLDWRRTRD